ncbi:hypothetical protein SDC9_199674 [bioreactor metagenome]|uniref:Uncharacterized protein n=1 Tax=bioreactor metagenome TaxID=1076179 RepID=A0A645IME7_9ZZZZ
MRYSGPARIPDTFEIDPESSVKKFFINFFKIFQNTDPGYINQGIDFTKFFSHFRISLFQGGSIPDINLVSHCHMALLYQFFSRLNNKRVYIHHHNLCPV